MTAGQIVTFIAAVWLLASGLGVGMFLLLAHRIYGRGVLAGQLQAELTHGYPAEPEPEPSRVRRRWSLLNRKRPEPVPQPPRPVLHTTR